jgi:hypothetical protein
MSLEKIIKGIKKTKSALKSLGYSAVSAIIGASLLAGSAKASAPQYEITKMHVLNIGGYCRTYLSNIDEGVIAGSYDISDNYEYPDRREISSKTPIVYINRKLCIFAAGFPEDFFGGAIDATTIVDTHGNPTGDIGVLLSEENRSTGGFISSYLIQYTMDRDEHPVSLFQLSFKANDMNRLGDVAGVDLARISRQTIRIGPEDSKHYIANAINDNRVIVGCIKEELDAPIGIPFIWEGGEITQLPIPNNFTGGIAIDINNNSQIIGYFTKIVRYIPHNIPCLWENGNYRELSPLKEVYSLNDSGQIVGAINLGIPNGERAALWDNGNVINLNDLFFSDPNNPDDWGYIHKATGINNQGQIIGEGILNRGKDWPVFTYVKPMYPFLLEYKLFGDLNNDDKVNGLDFAIMAGQWLEEK